MKTLIGQTNTTPRDFEGNVKQIIDGIRMAHTEGAELAVFPELSIPGYLCRDLIYSKGFVEQNLRYLQQIVEFSTSAPNVHAVVGYFDYNRTGVGKPFRNMAAVICNGLIVATYQKRLLPFYDVFDESRYCEPGKDLTVVTIGGIKWGIAICEDLWNDKEQDDYSYRDNPAELYRQIGVKNIISINSSPFYAKKANKRRIMLTKMFRDGICVYVNQIGGQDELIFDGHSTIIHSGYAIHQTPSTMDTSYEICKIARHTRRNVENETDAELLFKMLVLGLRDYIRKSGFKKAVVASSGGIDSAVVLALAVEAIGADNVVAIRMPSIWSSEGSKVDAKALHDALGVQDYIVPIQHEEAVLGMRRIFDPAFAAGKLGEFLPFNKVADENWQARERGKILMWYSNAFGALPLTTGNKSELAVGYCTLYGDMNGGLAVINDLYKLDVYDIAEFYNKYKKRSVIPEIIIEKAPSAELAPNQTDEASLLPYEILDPILYNYIEEYIGDFRTFQNLVRGPTAVDSTYMDYANLPEPVPAAQVFCPELVKWVEEPNAKAQYDRMIRLVDLSEYKRRQAAPGLKVSKVAFGTGRRLPIVKK